MMLALALALGACTNLAAVREFAKTSAATADFAQVVRDYQASPHRQLVYQPEDKAAQLRELAEGRKQEARRLLDCQQIVVDYMNALGDLAADDLVSVDSEIDGLTKALEDAKVIGKADSNVSKETATAAAAIAKILTRAVLNGWRQGQVCEIVSEVDPHLQEALAGLTAVLDQDLRGSLENERTAIEKRFNTWSASARANGDEDGAPPISRVLLAERVLVIERMEQQLDRYLEVLAKIAAGHRDLVENRKSLTAKAVIAAIKEHSKDLQTLYKQIRILAN